MTSIPQSWLAAPLRPLPAVANLTRQDYLASYRFRSPVLVRGGAARCAAVQKWDLAYLQRIAGEATVGVGNLAKSDPHDFTRRDEESMKLGALLRLLELGEVKKHTYLFNSDSSLFMSNPRYPGKSMGWGATAPNPGLASLALDFPVPDFIGDDYLFASLILGPPGSGTRLHYDWGGEAKAMVQIRGHKRVMLIPPSMACHVGLTNIFDGKSLGNDARADRQGGDDALPAGVWGFAADMEPGDILYFPAFWFHKIENSGPVNIAVGVGIDELPSSPLAMRFNWYLAARVLLQEASRRAGGDPEKFHLRNADRLEVHYEGRRIGSLDEFLSAWEDLLLSEPMRSAESYWTVAQDLLSAGKR